MQEIIGFFSVFVGLVILKYSSIGSIGSIGFLEYLVIAFKKTLNFMKLDFFKR